MRWLALFLTLAPSLVSATPPWSAEWFSDDYCKHRIDYETGTDTDREGKMASNLKRFKFTYDDQRWDMYNYNPKDKDRKKGQLGMSHGGPMKGAVYQSGGCFAPWADNKDYIGWGIKTHKS